MIEDIILAITFIIISGPLSLFIGKRFLKINQLKIWHIWLAVSSSLFISYLGFVLFQGVLLSILNSYLLCILVIATLILATFHLILKKLNPDIKFSQSFTLIFTLFLLVFIIVFLSIPFYNSQFNK